MKDVNHIKAFSHCQDLISHMHGTGPGPNCRQNMQENIPPPICLTIEIIHLNHRINCLIWTATLKLQIGDNIKWQLRAAAYDLVLFPQLMVINNSIRCHLAETKFPGYPRGTSFNDTLHLSRHLVMNKPSQDSLHRVECRYNAMQYIMILHKILQMSAAEHTAVWIHKRHPISRPHGRDTGCPLWVLETILTAL